MQIRLILLGLLPIFAAGCAGLHSSPVQSQNFILSFPNRLKPGELVVAFELTAMNAEIVAVNKLPFDWLISTLSEVADASISGFPNHGASVFEDMAPLERFVTIRKRIPQEDFDITGFCVVTRDFTRECTWTNYFTKADFVLEKVTSNPQGRANERQPNRSATNSTSSAAASHRSP